jgi:hypothetical protein
MRIWLLRQSNEKVKKRFPRIARGPDSRRDGLRYGTIIPAFSILETSDLSQPGCGFFPYKENHEQVQ